MNRCIACLCAAYVRTSSVLGESCNRLLRKSHFNTEDLRVLCSQECRSTVLPRPLCLHTVQQTVLTTCMFATPHSTAHHHSFTAYRLRQMGDLEAIQRTKEVFQVAACLRRLYIVDFWNSGPGGSRSAIEAQPWQHIRSLASQSSCSYGHSFQSLREQLQRYQSLSGKDGCLGKYARTGQQGGARTGTAAAASGRCVGRRA